MWRNGTPRRVWSALAATGALCVLAYWRALALPLISDDYLQIQLARAYGPVAGWAALAADPLYRCRATSLLLTHWTEQLFGFHALAFNVSSLLLHILNTWLVLALGAWRVVGWRISFGAACFFAVYEGHQEAVMWYAALPELLVFLFSMATLLLWLDWLRNGGGTKYAGALACFVLALLSKESAVAAVPLMLAGAGREWKWSLPRLYPFAALSLLYAAAIYGARAEHYHLHDGTFSPNAPFWIVLPFSTGRLLWVWGAASLAALAWWRAREHAPILRVAAVWIVVTLLPYSFLTYMPRVPSRHAYFASAGLALVIGAAFVELRERMPGRRMAAIATVVAMSQCGYIWTRKQGQLLERAAPTERLLRMAQDGRDELRIGCFPYPPAIAQSALSVHALNGVRLEFDRSGAAVDLCRE